MIYVGVDLHKTQFTVCVIFNGDILENGIKFRMDDKGMEAFASKMRQLSADKEEERIAIAVESTTNTRYFRERMASFGYEVTVVNTLRFKVVNLSTKKTDKNDARTLAEFLSKDMLPKSYLCTAKSEGLRRVLKSRALMVQDGIALKNQAHAVLLAYGYITTTAQFQSRRGRNEILATLSKDICDSVGVIFSTLDAVEEQKKYLEKRLCVITGDDEDIRLLMTIPGIGIVNACTIKAYIDNIDRFESYKHFSSYCGLAPWVQASNETFHIGRITKRGPSDLRTALVQCVVAMVRMKKTTGNLEMIRQYNVIKETKSSGKAIIATARKLTRIIYVMLKERTPFNANLLVRRHE